MARWRGFRTGFVVACRSVSGTDNVESISGKRASQRTRYGRCQGQRFWIAERPVSEAWYIIRTGYGETNIDGWGTWHWRYLRSKAWPRPTGRQNRRRRRRHRSRAARTRQTANRRGVRGLGVPVRCSVDGAAVHPPPICSRQQPVVRAAGCQQEGHLGWVYRRGEQLQLSHVHVVAVSTRGQPGQAWPTLGQLPDRALRVPAGGGRTVPPQGAMGLEQLSQPHHPPTAGEKREKSTHSHIGWATPHVGDPALRIGLRD